MMTTLKSILILCSQALNEIKVDAGRYRQWFFEPGFWVTCSYRIRRLRKVKRYMLFLLPLDLFLGGVRLFISDSKIPSVMCIGAGLYLPHPNGLIFNGKGVIGSNVAIFQQVTIGEWQGSAPIVGSHTSIFGGAKIFGNITIGSNCKIGANTVINLDVPENSSVSTAPFLIRSRS